MNDLKFLLNSCGKEKKLHPSYKTPLDSDSFDDLLLFQLDLQCGC